jgi:hypothetical protein
MTLKDINIYIEQGYLNTRSNVFGNIGQPTTIYAILLNFDK